MGLEFIGKNITRTDAVSKVTGAIRYTNDIFMPGMLYGKIFRSDHAHARIIRVHTEEAKKSQGVFDVLSSADLPHPIPRFGPVTAEQPVLADEKVKFYGEPVAVVLAETEGAAQDAVKKVWAEYEALPALCTIDQALAADALNIHANEAGLSCKGNVHSSYLYSWGDVEEAKKGSEYIIENTYEFPMIHHLPIEPFCVIAYPENGGVVIKSPVQHPFILRRVVASALNLSLSQVRVVSVPIGGGFGAKGYAKYEPLAAYLALRTGRPVKLHFSMNEGFYTARRLSARVKIASGFDRTGRIVFQDVVADYQIGAYADSAPRVVAKAGYLGGCGPYRVPNVRTTANAIYSNTVPSTAARGFGMPQMVWAIESQLNEACRLIGIDALEIRLRNLPNRGETLVPEDTPADGDWKQGIKLAAEMIGWHSPKAAGLGRSISVGIKNPVPAAVSNAIVKLHADDSVTVAVGTTEMGQGARTVFTQIAAEALGLPVERITVVMGDTATVPFDLCTAGSRSTVSMGNAVNLACKDILRQLREMAHELKLIDIGEEVKISGGLVEGCNGVISYPELLQKYLGVNQGEVIGRGVFKGTKDPTNALGGLTDFWEVIFTAAEVKVDAETGKVTVNKLVNVSDIGKAINPLQAKSQEEGASIMAMGHALMEQMIYDEGGRLKNGGALDYRIPTIMDVPRDMKSAFIENQDGPGPYGAKGLGESGAISPAPAIADAVRDATGVWIKDLPLTPEKVWRALNDR
ncbi:xanthine dehydrogenase family protein molybdopterin-binding subunit [Anaeroselena agilis]|uniref:Xanthine dehydrogenase family protein molybdopterin-binding subunit n=1 Tax=Anaeroselena agilis TaxID=3063788 RepID=A0ABU3P372_9FIRM|nr:xanthine dehydrogenase family protein molybdopterin-binding subunit [Selenomonadales bacterium 4137-cl]